MQLFRQFVILILAHIWEIIFVGLLAIISGAIWGVWGMLGGLAVGAIIAAIIAWMLRSKGKKKGRRTWKTRPQSPSRRSSWHGR